MTAVKKAHIIQELQSEILRLQGFKPAINGSIEFGLDNMNSAFPNGIFPLGAIHEFMYQSPEDIASTQGFLAGLLRGIMSEKGTAIWIGHVKAVFPPGLSNFGVQPHRILFINLNKEREIMWAMEEALKCNAISAVVGQINDLSFTASRRLQLAVEQSKVTGFILRKNSSNPGTTASVSRWRISADISSNIDGLPGLGFPTWKVELLRIKNGKPGQWKFTFQNGKFAPVDLIKPSNLKLNDDIANALVVKNKVITKHRKAG